MAEVFTLSGSPVDVLDGAAYSFGRGLGDACAEHVSKLVVTAKVAKYLGVGAGLFGAYKMGQKHAGLGVFSILAGVALWVSEGQLWKHSKTVCYQTPPGGTP